MEYTQDIMHKATEAERIARYNAAKANLIQITTEDEPHNWTLFGNPDTGIIYSIARPGQGASSSYFGKADHVKNLIREGHFSDTLTEAGKAFVYGG